MLFSLLVLVSAGCGGGGGHDQREAVDAYVAAANRAQAAHLSALNTVDGAFRAFSKGSRDATTLRRLAHASAVIAATRASLRRLHPPAEAQAVQRDLLRLYRREASLAAEVRGLAVYLPAVTRALGRLDSANAALGKAVRPGVGADAEAAAVGTYAGRVRDVRAKLTALEPPAALRPWHDEEAAWLAALARDAQRLAGALRADRAAASVAAAAFRDQSARSPGVTRAQQWAARAYDSRVDAISQLAARAQRELEQLDRRLR